MEYIINKLNAYCVKYEKISETALRVYGNFKGFSSVRKAREGWVEVDGRLKDKEDFEKWLYSITI